MNLIYRTYKDGDEVQLAEVYNLAFKPMFEKTAEEWAWKYVENPDFDPKSIQICEDIDNGKLVGMMASEIHEVTYNDDMIKLGFVNDVATIPDYQKLGIGWKLMDQVIEYFENNGAKYSSLVADPRGHPRSKLYVPSGYKDIMKNVACVHISNLNKLCFKEIKLMIPFAPILYLIKFFRLIIDRIRFRNKYNGYTVRILNKNEYINFYTKCNEIHLRDFDLAPKRSIENWKWRRENLPRDQWKPNIIVLERDGEIIGGASLITRVAQIKKPKLTITMGLISEYFVDIKEFKTHTQAREITGWFNRNLVRISRKNGNSILLGFIAGNNGLYKRFYKYSGAITMKAATFMVKEHSEAKTEFNARKPLFMPIYDIMGIP